MRKVYNFSAGPAMLPEEVLLSAQSEMLDWHNTGMSIMEIGHRGPEFKALAEQSERDLRDLMKIPDNYHILFLPGGATTQFAMVPLNLLNKNNKADYVDTGIWSKKAIAEAKRYGDIHVAASIKENNNVLHIPHQNEWKIRDDIRYLHYTPNETIEGIEFNWIPKIPGIPLVADMSSMILSRPIDVAQYGLIYAGAQKNIGQAGVTIVIIRDDLVETPFFPHVPTLYQYQVQVENHSFYNTPPTYSWYIAALVFAWMKRHGGVEAFYARNKRKANSVYSCVSRYPEFYRCPIHPEDRSLMNVVFSLKDDTLTKQFLDEANAAGLTNLRGHRTVGGVRASLYNSMPEEGAKALVDFMEAFANRNS